MSIETHYIDFEQVIRDRFPNNHISLPVFYLLKKIAHINDFNRMFASLEPKMNVEFMKGVINYLQLNVKVYGSENLHKNDSPSIFASNHPLGALDAVTIGSVLGDIYGENIKFYANEILNELKPLKDMFLPIYKYGMQSRENVAVVKTFFETKQHLITFPAGATSRMRKNKLQDLVWHKNFIQKSIEHHRNVVPLYFDAKNSSFFYALQHIREFIRSNKNFEMLFLPSEIFKQKGNLFNLYIGDPINWQFFDRTKTPTQWAAFVKDKSYQLPQIYAIS